MAMAAVSARAMSVVAPAAVHKQAAAAAPTKAVHKSSALAARVSLRGEALAIGMRAASASNRTSTAVQCAISVAPPPVIGYFPSRAGFPKGKVGILVEEHFDPFEYRSYNAYYTNAGYDVEYLSYLWGNASLVFTSNPNEGKIEESVLVHTCVSKVDPRDYKGLLIIGAYATDRLRYQPKVWKGKKNDAPAVEFMRQAMQHNVPLGNICHSLWLFCADPDLIRGKKVTCAHNIVSDVEAAGADIVYDGEGTAELVIDGNLVCGKHPGMVEYFNDKFLEVVAK